MTKVTIKYYYVIDIIYNNKEFKYCSTRIENLKSIIEEYLNIGALIVIKKQILNDSLIEKFGYIVIL